MPYITYYKPMTAYDPHADIETRRRVLQQIRGRKETIFIEDITKIDYTKVPPLITHANYYYNAKRILQSKYNTDIVEYTVFQIPKRSGGMRTIEAPSEYGKAIQRVVLQVLRDVCKILEHDAAYGFVTRRNCKQSMIRHQENNSQYFLKLDIDNFFPSLTRDVVLRALKNTAQCAYWGNFVNRMLDHCAFYEGRLSQGSPLSPYLANIAMLKFDVLMTEYANRQGLVYTRYADDILISSAQPIQVAKTIEKVKSLLQTNELNLRIKESKTRYGTNKGRNWNLGIMYNKDFDLTVGHEAKHTMKVIAHKWNTLGPEDKAHFCGLLAYYKSIEPEYFNQERFNVIGLD